MCDHGFQVRGNCNPERHYIAAMEVHAEFEEWLCLLWKEALTHYEHRQERRKQAKQQSLDVLHLNVSPSQTDEPEKEVHECGLYFSMRDAVVKQYIRPHSTISSVSQELKDTLVPLKSAINDVPEGPIYEEMQMDFQPSAPLAEENIDEANTKFVLSIDIPETGEFNIHSPDYDIPKPMDTSSPKVIEQKKLTYMDYAEQAEKEVEIIIDHIRKKNWIKIVDTDLQATMDWEEGQTEDIMSKMDISDPLPFPMETQYMNVAAIPQEQKEQGYVRAHVIKLFRSEPRSKDGVDSDNLLTDVEGFTEIKFNHRLHDYYWPYLIPKGRHLVLHYNLPQCADDWCECPSHNYLSDFQMHVFVPEETWQEPTVEIMPKTTVYHYDC